MVCEIDMTGEYSEPSSRRYTEPDQATASRRGSRGGTASGRCSRGGAAVLCALVLALACADAGVTAILTGLQGAGMPHARGSEGFVSAIQHHSSPINLSKVRAPSPSSSSTWPRAHGVARGRQRWHDFSSG
jgi:hypothetical protein